MKHKHCEVIKAWAEGKAIQCKQSGSIFFKPDQWVDCSPTWQSDVEYRVKPEIKEFRLAKMRTESGSECINFYFDRENEKAVERKPIFVKWLTNWQEVEV